MMLTPVTEAKSASDQLRDSRSSRIAAPADSRLIAALRPYSGYYTELPAHLDIYVFISLLLRAGLGCVYAFVYVSTARRRTNGASMLGQPGDVVRLRR